VTDLFRKLNYKSQDPILVLGAPASFEAELSAMEGGVTMHREPAEGKGYAFILAFGVMRADIVAAAQATSGILVGDAVAWYIYPKASSRSYASDLSRDIMWEALSPFGLRPVRQVAIDDDWSALRFRREEFVGS